MIGIAALLAACGGGGSGDGGAPGPAVSTPAHNVVAEYTVEAGVAQKGPLLRGSIVTLNELSPLTLQPAGSAFNFEIQDDAGTFNPSGTVFKQRYVEATAIGYYYDEIAGTPAPDIIFLRSLSDLSTDRMINLNVLTELAAPRIRTLFKSGKSFADAKVQAQKEVLRAFGTRDAADLFVGAEQPSGFGDLDLAKFRTADQLLAAISAVIVKAGATGSGVSVLLSQLKSDLADDGLLNNSPGIAPAPAIQISAAMAGVDWSAVARNINTQYRSTRYSADLLRSWVDTSGGTDGVRDGMKFVGAQIESTTVYRSPAYIVTADGAGSCFGATAGVLLRNGHPQSLPVAVARADSIQLAISGNPGETNAGFLVHWKSDTGCGASVPSGATRVLKATAQFAPNQLLEALRARAALGGMPQLMPTPPVVTIGVRNGASSIANSTLLAWNSGKFQATSEISQAGSLFPDSGLGAFRTVSYSASNRRSNQVQISFRTNAATFEILTKGIGAGGDFRIMVDGQLVSNVPVRYAADGGLYLTRVTFPDAADRRITLLSGSPYFGGVRIPAGATVSLPTKAAFRTMVFGDSFAEGQASFATIASSLLGWEDSWLSAVDGAGYFATAGSTYNLLQRFDQDVLPYAPDVLVIAGGLGDRNSTDEQVQVAATALFDRVQSKLPRTMVFVLGPWNPRSMVRAGINRAIKLAAANRPNFMWVPNYDAAWITGTGRAGAERSDGNSDWLIGNDGMRPTEAGATYLGQKLADTIKTLISKPQLLIAAPDVTISTPDGFVRSAGVPSFDLASYERRTFQGMPSIARVGRRLWAVSLGDRNTPGGELPGTYLTLSYSDDGGSRWSRELYLVPSRPTTDRIFDPRLWAAPDGKLWVLYAQAGNSQTHDGQDGAWATIISTPLDEAPTFEPGFWLADGVPMRPFEYGDGWAIPIDYPFSPAPRFTARAGKNIYKLDWVNRRVTFLTKGPRSPNADFDESAAVQLRDGSLLLQSRTLSGIVQTRASATDLTWSAVERFGASPSIGSRHVIRRSPTGRLVMVFNKSLAGSLRTDMTIMLSDDEGVTWPYAYTFDRSTQISYPDIEFDLNGDILVVYDLERWNQKKILLARFQENSLVTGLPNVTINLVNQPNK
jgi:lysophospholipase L1-like esterase